MTLIEHRMMELPRRIRIPSEGELCLSFNLESRLVLIQLNEGSGTDSAAPRIKKIISDSGVLELDTQVLEIRMDDYLADFLESVSGGIGVQVMLPPTNECYELPQAFAKEEGPTFTVVFSDAPAGEYCVLMRGMCGLCGGSYTADSTPSFLSVEKVRTAVHRCYKEFANAAFEHALGFSVRKDFYQQCRNAMYGSGTLSFSDFAEGLRYCFTQSTWVKAQIDYRTWRNGGLLCRTEGEPWLVTADGAEANPSDMAHFFQLLTALNIDLAYFEPVPEGMTQPEMMLCHTYFDAVSVQIGFRCMEDGGLLSDPSPCGNTYELKSDKGLKAVLRVKEVGGLHSRDYCCEGYVEGFTAKNRRQSDIHIYLSKDGEIECLGLLMGREDWPEYSAFPLWQDYRDWSAKHSEAASEAEEELFDSFLFGRPIGQNR